MDFFRQPWKGVSLGRKIVASAWLFGTGMCLLSAAVLSSIYGTNLLQMLAPPLIGCSAAVLAYFAGVSSRPAVRGKARREGASPQHPVPPTERSAGLNRETTVLIYAIFVAFGLVVFLSAGPDLWRFVASLLFAVAAASAFRFARWESPEEARAVPVAYPG